MKNSAWLPGVITVFSVLSFGATQDWSRNALTSLIYSALLIAGVRILSCCVERLPVAYALLAVLPATGIAQLALNTTVDRWATLKATLTWGIPFSAAVVALTMLSDPAARSGFLRCFAAGSGVYAAIGILQVHLAPGRLLGFAQTGRPRVVASFVNPDHFCVFVELALPVAAWLAISEIRGRLMFSATTAVLFGAAVMSGSRAGVAIATAELLAVCIAAQWRRKRMCLARDWVRIAVLALAAVGVTGWQALASKVNDTDPWRFRREIALSSFRLLQDNPLGHGLGTFSLVYPQYAAFDTGLLVDHAHNDYLEIGVEGGIPLLLALALFALSFAWRVRCQFWAWGVVGVLLHAAVDFPLAIPGLVAPAFTLAGAAFAETASQLSATTGLRSSPSPATRMTTSSPATSHRGGFLANPTPEGVPVEIMSPGSRVKT
jgi:hypothetical protein